MKARQRSAIVSLFLLFLLLSSLSCLGSEARPPASGQQEPDRPGFTDTPYLPGDQWHVHDPARPYPPVVQPADKTGEPPSDAVMLFDGKALSNWYARTEDGEKKGAGWKVENGHMEVVGGTGTIYTEQEFGDCQLHIEWATPKEVTGTSQGSGNSGVLLMGQYEIQVLNSYENLTYADGQAAAMYGQYPPLVNASRGPGEWQSYDIVFEAPRWKDNGELEKPAYVTVFHNGVVVHHRQPFIGRMTYRQVATYAPHGKRGPLGLQDHGNPIRYRNIWVRPLGAYDSGQ